MDHHFRIESLPTIRAMLEGAAQLKTAFGPLARFELVIDTNILVNDVRWLAEKRLNPAARTDLLECVVAGTIVAHITPEVALEVEEILARLAIDQGINLEQCLREWRSYKKLLSVCRADPAVIAKYLSGADPDDAPTLALAETLRAAGIVSRDLHIRQMGGTAIPVSFVTEVRDYSRKACISLTIEICGYTLVVGTVGALKIAVTAIRNAVAGFVRLPDGIKWLCLAALLIILLNPKARGAVLNWIENAAKAIGEMTPLALREMMLLVEMAAENRVPPPIVPSTREGVTSPIGRS